MPDDEEELLRSVALQNAKSILLARQRAEQEMLRAKEELERRTQELAGSLAMMRATLESTWTAPGDGCARQRDRLQPRYVDMWRVPRESWRRWSPRIVEYTAPVRESQPFLARSTNLRGVQKKLASGSRDEGVRAVLGVHSSMQERRSCGAFATSRDSRRRTSAALLESDGSPAPRRAGQLDEGRVPGTLSHGCGLPERILGGLHPSLAPHDEATSEGSRSRAQRPHADRAHRGSPRNEPITSAMVFDVQPVEPGTFSRPRSRRSGPRPRRRASRSASCSTRAGPVMAIRTGSTNRLELLSNGSSSRERWTRSDPARARESQVEITVADTGIGIPPEFLPHVFDRFRQADSSATRTAKGLGLGLSIVKHLVEQHGGSVHVTSPGEGQGATFSLQIPLTVVHRKGIGGIATDFKRSDLSGVTVLVIDDQADARDLFRSCRLLLAVINAGRRRSPQCGLNRGPTPW